MAVLLQQSLEVVRNPYVKRLAIVWVIQNLFLVTCVYLRLKLYVEAYQLSLQRVGVFCFLLIVFGGFVLILIQILKEKNLKWLILTNGVLVFFVFYLLQFFDINRLVANYNVTSWQANSKRSLDLGYLRQLGPSAWPALQSLTKHSAGTPEALEAQTILHQNQMLERAKKENWRSWQWRQTQLRAILFSENHQSHRP